MYTESELKQQLLLNLKKTEKIAGASKITRMLNNPIKYIEAIFFRSVIYKRSKQEIKRNSKTFYNVSMSVLLPSSTDIYLTGGKSHNSEIRLAKFLINELSRGDTFIDVGAHYGYFTLLASILVGDQSGVYAFEASPRNFEILVQNTGRCNITSVNRAVTNKEESIVFYEFPNRYSEYNTINSAQFKNQTWFSEYPPTEVNVKETTLDKFISEHSIKPTVIKIDVEGAEYKVINGIKDHLKDYAPVIVMEYLNPKRDNNEHVKADKFLKALNYNSFVIESDGSLIETNSIHDYLKENRIDSDNIVYLRK